MALKSLNLILSVIEILSGVQEFNEKNSCVKGDSDTYFMSLNFVTFPIKCPFNVQFLSIYCFASRD